MRTALNFALVALVALVIVALPGGDQTLYVLLRVLTIAFFTAIALFGYRLYTQNRMLIDGLTNRQRLVLYSSIGVAFLAFTATRRLFDAGGLGLLAWFALLAAASYGAFWVYAQSRQFE